MPTATYTGVPLNKVQALNQIVANTSGGISAGEPVGAKNLSSSQVTLSTSASTLANARPTRTSVLFTNLDSSISVYIGPATVTSGNGQILKAGQSIPYTFTGLIQGIAASGTPTVSVADEYN